MDLCQQLLAAAFRIEYCPELLNLHLPPPKSGQVKRSQLRLAERARYYTSLKRYLLWQRKPLKAGAFLAAAPLHQAAHSLRHRHVAGTLHGFVDVGWALGRMWSGRRGTSGAAVFQARLVEPRIAQELSEVNA
jgi:hypothetical protein